MNKDNPSVLDVLQKAFDESNGEIADLVIEHSELSGVTLDMWMWWRSNINSTSRYKLWCPEEHISFKWEVSPAEDPLRPIHRAEERVGEFPSSVLRIRREDPKLSPIRTVYEYFGLSSILGNGDQPVAMICHEVREVPGGLKMRSTFRLPARTPEKFVNAMREHCKLEMGHIPKFLPDLYQRHKN
jgi:hypothetical protein